VIDRGVAVVQQERHCRFGNAERESENVFAIAWPIPEGPPVTSSVVREDSHAFPSSCRGTSSNVSQLPPGWAARGYTVPL
jgi:hypothetical protein